MTNYERYLELHNEIMNRLENGEITTEQAKEVNDLAFDKYIVEKVSVEVNPDLKRKIDDMMETVLFSLNTCKSLLKKMQNKIADEIDNAKSDAYRDTAKQYDSKYKVLADKYAKYANEYTTLKNLKTHDNATISRIKQLDDKCNKLRDKLYECEDRSRTIYDRH